MIIMIQVHVLDAWTLTSARSSDTFRDLQVIGGLAAPLFLWLAGIALVLSAEQQVRRTGDRNAAWKSVVKRGLEIFVLAFVFRLTSFLFSFGASPLSIFRVDVLNILGLAIAAAGVIWGVVSGRGAQATVFAAGALAVAMATPVIRVAGWVGDLPIWVQWYLRPAGEHTTFTGLPWAGFVFAGSAVGTAVTALGESGERRFYMGLAAGGAALVAVGLYMSSLPSIYRESSFWTSSPTFFVVRVGVLMVGLAALFMVLKSQMHPIASAQWLPALGRSSLFIYWVHVELVYGWAGWPIRRRLSVEQALFAWVALVAFMYALLGVRDRLVASVRLRRLVAQWPVVTRPWSAHSDSVQNIGN